MKRGTDRTGSKKYISPEKAHLTLKNKARRRVVRLCVTHRLRRHGVCACRLCFILLPLLVSLQKSNCPVLTSTKLYCDSSARGHQLLRWPCGQRHYCVKKHSKSLGGVRLTVCGPRFPGKPYDRVKSATQSSARRGGFGLPIKNMEKHK